MLFEEGDEQSDIQNEIRRLENELAGLGSDIYEIAMRRKFLRHKIADLEYEMKHPDE